ncbi:MAG: SIMPL domain-containing protein [Candidatus Hydrogenedentes bacterium]|nr:SIMPL domain-containing protein [Candidatus Hydrogenedentota bacterium]
MTLLRKSALALILAILAIPVHPEEPAIPNGVSVTGTAVMSVSPDIISWSIQVKDTNPDLMTAKTSNDARLRDVMQLIRELGIPTEDVSTQFLRVNKEYDRDPQGNQGAFKHHVVERYVNVRQRDFSRFDEFFDALVQRAGAEVSYSLESSRVHELRIEARKKATEIAREKAEAMVTQLGGRLGRVLSVEEYRPDFSRQAPFSNGVFFEQPDANAPDIQEGTLAPGSIEVRCSISAVFEIL